MKIFKEDRLIFCEFRVLPFLLYFIALLDLGKNPHRTIFDFPFLMLTVTTCDIIFYHSTLYHN